MAQIHCILTLCLNCVFYTYVILSQSQKDDDLDSVDDSFEPWALKRAGILAKYTTSEKLSITTSFLSTNDQERG